MFKSFLGTRKCGAFAVGEQSADVVGGIAPVVLSKTHPYFYVGNPEGGLTTVSEGASERSENANTLATTSDPRTVIEIRGLWDTYTITAAHPNLTGGVDSFFEFRAVSSEYVGEGELA